VYYIFRKKIGKKSSYFDDTGGTGYAETRKWNALSPHLV